MTGSLPAGVHSVRWGLDDRAGAPVPAGVYFVRLQLVRGPAGDEPIVVIR